VDVRVELAKAFSNIMYHEPIQLSPFVGDLIVWMIQASGSEFEELALAALEFWPNIARHFNFVAYKKALLPKLSILLPLLLKNMVYSEEQRDARMKNPYDDPSVPDRDQDIRPCMQNSRKVVGLAIQDEEEEEGDDEDVINEWTVRQASAKSLEKMATLFGPDVMPIIFPAICERLAAQQPWDVKESAILALGAIQNGSSSCLSTSRVSILGFLLDLMNHEQVW
jgi:transportin-1